MSYRKVVKITILIYKKPDIDEGQFQERFIHHARSLKDAMIRHGVLAYSQVRGMILGPNFRSTSFFAFACNVAAATPG